MGRNPDRFDGFVNTPIYRGSTVLFPTLEKFRARDQEFTYGRRGTPTIRALEEAVTELEGGELTVLTPSGLNAISCALLSVVEAGDHVLVTDSVYRPGRKLCENLLKRLGVETTYYDPGVGDGISDLIRDNTKLIYVESPGSQTFEIQDLPAIAKAARGSDVRIIADNTWATPLYYSPLALGADIVINAGTKYFGGHADANLGTITTNERTAEAVKWTHGDMGICPGPEDVFLCLRGLRTLSGRLAQHEQAALEMAKWLQAWPEVTRVMHPGLPDDPGHAIWKRDFRGSSGLFSVLLEPVREAAVAAMVDDLELFGMGASWGSFESLVLPFNPAAYRTATPWTEKGMGLRFHVGLENLDDLKADLEAGFARMAAAA